MIETCFEMLKSSEHEKLRSYSTYKSPNFDDCSEVFIAGLPISIYYPFRTLSIPWLWRVGPLDSDWF